MWEYCIQCACGCSGRIRSDSNSLRTRILHAKIMNKLTQNRLIRYAAIFLFLQTLLITLSPAVRLRAGDVEYRFSQWIAVVVWGVLVLRAHLDITRNLPDADPYIFP